MSVYQLLCRNGHLLLYYSGFQALCHNMLVQSEGGAFKPRRDFDNTEVNIWVQSSTELWYLARVLDCLLSHCIYRNESLSVKSVELRWNREVCDYSSIICLFDQDEEESWLYLSPGSLYEGSKSITILISTGPDK
jgi:hypothetical protein